MDGRRGAKAWGVFSPTLDGAGAPFGHGSTGLVLSEAEQLHWIWTEAKRQCPSSAVQMGLSKEGIKSIKDNGDQA